MEKDTKFATEEPGGLRFDPIVIVRDVCKRWLWILLVAVAVVMGTYIVSDLRYEPVYTTEATFVVTHRDGEATVFSDLTSTTNVTMVFEELLNSDIMWEKLQAHLGDLKFDGTITASAIPETNLLTVKVTAGDPSAAFRVMRAILDHHEELTYEVVDDVLMEVLQKPTVPTAPSNQPWTLSQMKKLLVVAVLAATAAMAVFSCMRNTVRSGREARAKLDCDYLGEVPHERKYKTLRARLSRRGSSILITNPLTGFAFTEAVRKLRRRIERKLKDRRVLMVTSLLENEGKSTVAMNLALAMAWKKERVLLIDCDLRKPACYKLFGHQMGEYGLRDVLDGRATLEKTIFRDKKSGLYLLLERKGDRDSGALLSGAAIQELIHWARGEFDCVILDLPPMAAVSDAESVAEYADASILVVRQNAADADALNRAVARLQRGRAKLLGCVLNNAYSSRLSSGMGYGYGYGYGYGRYGYYGKYGRYGKYAANEEAAGDGE